MAGIYTTDTYPTDPKRFGFQGVPSTRQLVPYAGSGTDLVPDSTTGRLNRAAYNAKQQAQAFRGKYGNTLGPETVQASGRVNIPTGGIDPWVEPGGTGSASGAGGVFRGLKNLGKFLVSDPTVSVGAGLAANEALLERNLKQPNRDASANLEAGLRLPISSYPQKALTNVIARATGYDPNKEGVGSSYFGKAVEALTPVPELAEAGRFSKTTEAEGVKIPDEAERELLSAEKNAVSEKDAVTTASPTPKKAESGIYSYNPKAKNIFGESVQALDEQGGYRVGAGKNSATVIPWSPSAYDALARTLPAEQYNQLAAQKRSMEDQRATAIVPESSEESFERTKRGSSESSRSSRGGFNPDANEISGAYSDSTAEDAVAKAEAEILKNQQVQEQKQRAARLWADATNPDSSEEKRNDAFSVLQKIDPDAFAKYVRSNAAL